MSELRTFGASDLLAAADLARRVTAHAKAEGRTHRALAADPVAAMTEGLKGEWAVADSLGVRRAPESLAPDPGYDVVSAAGVTIAVRYRRRSDGHLMCLVAHPFTAEAVVLVVATAMPETVRIVGGLDAVDFFQRARCGDFRHGPTLYVPQAELVPWASFKVTL